MKSDYLPRREAELIDWTFNFIKVAGANTAEWEIPRDEIDEIAGLLAEFRKAHGDCAGPNSTTTLTSQKNAVKEKLTAKIRGMVRFRFENPRITSAMRVEAGLNAYDTVRSSKKQPENRPEFVVKVRDIRQLEVDFWEQGTAGKAKPYGIAGAVIYLIVLDHVPSCPEELIATALATKTPFVLHFAEQDRGKTVYIALKWQNTKGEEGPFSEIQAARVP